MLLCIVLFNGVGLKTIAAHTASSFGTAVQQSRGTRAPKHAHAYCILEIFYVKPYMF